MQWFFDLIEPLNLGHFTLRDLVDIILVAVGVYFLLVIIQGTRAMRVALGLIFLLLLSSLSRTYQLSTVQWLFANFSAYLVIAIIILFQSEIRRALAQFGKNPFRKINYKKDENLRTLEEICLAASLLASKRIGGIIVLEREQGLRNYVEAGRKIDSEVNYDLLLSIFHPSSPLHDGAAIIHDNRLAAASCFLPLTSNPTLSGKFGTRHRAAIGLTEETDAVAVIISEERGEIRVSQLGKISRPLNGKGLMALLTRLLVEAKRIPKGDVGGRTVEMVAYEFPAVGDSTKKTK